MRKHLFRLGVVAAAALLATSAFAANRGVTFTPIGFIDDPGPFPASQVFDMNGSGDTLIVNPSAFGAYCVKWTDAGGWGEQIGSASSVCEISRDGSTIMASGYLPDGTSQAAVWAGAVDTWNPIPLPDGFEPCGNSGLSFFGMSPYGGYSTGLTWEGCSTARAYRWDGTTTTNLGSMNGESSRGNAIDGDGSTIVGWTAMLNGQWRGARWDNGVWSFIDGQGNIDPKTCVGSGEGCTADYECAAYVDDSFCDTAVCGASGTCEGGPVDGQACGYDWDCQGYCVGGPNDGDTCTGDYYCPDTPVCLDNPDWNLAAYKGEAFDVTADGKYVLGVNYGDSDYNSPDYDWTLWSSAYIEDDHGKFTKLPPPDTGFPGDSWTPVAISDNGEVAVGRFGWWIYSFPVVWTKWTGTLDLQVFLVSQGLDDLWYWYLTDATAVSSNGRIIAGAGYNPDFWIEGFKVDISKLAVCHAPGGDLDKARTLTISLESAADHLGHGDFLGTCEFVRSGAHSRAVQQFRADQPQKNQTPPDFDGRFRSRDEMEQMSRQFGATYVDVDRTDTQPTTEPQQQRTGRERSPKQR